MIMMFERYVSQERKELEFSTFDHDDQFMLLVMIMMVKMIMVKIMMIMVKTMMMITMMLMALIMQFMTVLTR